MYKAFQSKMAKSLLGKSLHTDDEVYLYLISQAATVFCILVHVYLWVVYLANGLLWYVGANSVSLLLYGAVLALHRRRRYAAATLLLSADVTLYATLTVFLSGIATYTMGYSYIQRCDRNLCLGKQQKKNVVIAG